MQRLITEHNPERVLFVTYRQTLALDIMRNFGKLQFKNYLDACNDPSIWEAPILIIQIDSLMNILLHDGSHMNGDEFNLTYDMIVLDEGDSLMNHFNEMTINHNKFIFCISCKQFIKYTPKMVLMDGDFSHRSFKIRIIIW